jgi:hypothetical protein
MFSGIIILQAVSNKDLLEECDKEENLAVIGTAITSCLKRKL